MFVPPNQSIQSSHVYPAAYTSADVPAKFQPPSNGTAFKVPSLNIPDSIMTSSGKPYCENDLFNDVEAKTQSAWFGVDPIRGTMGNPSAKLWPKIFCSIMCCTAFCNFMILVAPACGYFCGVLGGNGKNSLTAWDMYIPCNSTCVTEHCISRRAQWTESDYLDDSTSCVDAGIPWDNPKGYDGNGKPNNKLVYHSRLSRATPAGNILIFAGYIIVFWPCCWGAAFAPAYFGVGPKQPGSHHACGPLNGPNTSRLIFTVVALSNAIIMLSLLPAYLSPQMQKLNEGLPGYLAITSILFYLFGASRFVVGTILCKPSRRNTHASLVGFISIAVANVIQMAGLVNTSDLGRKKKPDGTNDGDTNILISLFIPPTLLFFFMLIYLCCGRCYYRYWLANIATYSDKKTYDKMWFKDKNQLSAAPASNLKASKHGRKVVAHRPRDQMFYVDGKPPSGERFILMQPFDGDHHPHKRVVVLFHFAGLANIIFQQYINEWSASVPGTHPKNSPVKSPVRAVQKLQRSYGLEHALRLLDLVRASVVCPDLHMLANVVDIIHKDQRVKVLREKNAWADGFVSPTGYRNYQMIVQLLNTNCAGFLCEIQLDLQSFHDEKNRPGSSGHANYKKRRNYMGE